MYIAPKRRDLEHANPMGKDGCCKGLCEVADVLSPIQVPHRALRSPIQSSSSNVLSRQYPSVTKERS